MGHICRSGRELVRATARLPEAAPLAGVCGAARVVLDGELVVGAGRASDFYGVLSRIGARSRRVPFTFVAFDVLAYHGRAVVDEPYTRRRDLLEGLALNGPAWCTAPQLHGTVTDALAACVEHDVEGIVAKRVDSRYRPGERSNDWLKLKTAEWRAMHAPRRREAV